ncbi:hypothetical protein GOP47_0016564 [Adiantum capillus-veneris]|uniref:Shikimate kinase n=1 Tax=Adiantum capillus-veneris TaxID=13818 RepID=A0A9D4UIQ5_ADICA|nr:hypothetical protein GOP47_0016564 [Adiantum capillus-veneris]
MHQLSHAPCAVAFREGQLPRAAEHATLVAGRRPGSVLCKAFGVQQDDEGKVLLKKRGSEIARDLRGTCIYLVGMTGSGKSKIGQTLAEAVGYHFFDSDKLIEKAAGDGRTVSQLMEEEDEKSFRDVETEVLKQLSCMGRLVVATGDGIVLRPFNWSYLRHGVTVWLDVPVEALAIRVGEAGEKSQPMLGQTTDASTQGQAVEKLSDILKTREPFYADSDATVSFQKVASQIGLDGVDSLTPTMVALEVLEEINKLIIHRR